MCDFMEKYRKLSAKYHQFPSLSGQQFIDILYTCDKEHLYAKEHGQQNKPDMDRNFYHN